jgi:hypothetical protein
MFLRAPLIIIFWHTSLVFSQFPYQNQALKLPKHPSNWICTVHITVATFAKYTSFDITERFLMSNREGMISTLSTMLNRSISIEPVLSFFEPCTISVLIDAIINGSSYVNSNLRIVRYINSNTYAFRGWRQSVIIVIYFLCRTTISPESGHMPHRLFYHSLDCASENIFPSHAFVYGPLQKLWKIYDPTYNFHHRQLPGDIARSVSKPEYGWDEYDATKNLEFCSAYQYYRLSVDEYCSVGKFAVYQYQQLLNFTAVQILQDVTESNGWVYTSNKNYNVMNSIILHTIDSNNVRVIYCNHNLDSARPRPIDLSSPFSFETWVMLGFVLTLCAIASTLEMYDLRLHASKLTTVNLLK